MVFSPLHCRLVWVTVCRLKFDAIPHLYFCCFLSFWFHIENSSNNNKNPCPSQWLRSFRSFDLICGVCLERRAVLSVHTDVIFQCHSLKGLSFLSNKRCPSYQCTLGSTQLPLLTVVLIAVVLTAVTLSQTELRNACTQLTVPAHSTLIVSLFWQSMWIKIFVSSSASDILGILIVTMLNLQTLGIQKFKHWINSSDLWNDVFFKFPSHQPVLTFREPNCLFLREWFLRLLLWNHFFNSLNSDHLQHINTHLSNLKLCKVPIFWMLHIDDNHLQT